MKRGWAKWSPTWFKNRLALNGDQWEQTTEHSSSRTFAMPLEGGANHVGIMRQKLAKWFGSKSKIFPDGTKMTLVLPFQSIISFNCKTKYSALVTRQAALLDRLCFSSTWDLAANLELDKPDPVDNLWNLNHSLTLLINLLLFKWNHTYISPWELLHLKVQSMCRTTGKLQEIAWQIINNIALDEKLCRWSA